MNRVEYIATLDRLLNGLEEQERRDALEFYFNYFADAEESGKTEQQVMEELGPPARVAAKIISSANFRAKSTASEQAFRQAEEKKSVFRGVQGVFLAIGAVIIALPGAAIAGVIALSLLIAAVSVLIGLLAAAAAIPLALLGTAVGLFVAVPVLGPYGAGAGLVCLGLALMAGVGLYALMVLLVRLIGRLVKWLLSKIEKSKRKEAA